MFSQQDIKLLEQINTNLTRQLTPGNAKKLGSTSGQAKNKHINFLARLGSYSQAMRRAIIQQQKIGRSPQAFVISYLKALIDRHNILFPSEFSDNIHLLLIDHAAGIMRTMECFKEATSSESNDKKVTENRGINADIFINDIYKAIQKTAKEAKQEEDNKEKIRLFKINSKTLITNLSEIIANERRELTECDLKSKAAQMQCEALQQQLVHPTTKAAIVEQQILEKKVAIAKLNLQKGQLTPITQAIDAVITYLTRLQGLCDQPYSFNYKTLDAITSYTREDGLLTSALRKVIEQLNETQQKQLATAMITFKTFMPISLQQWVEDLLQKLQTQTQSVQPDEKMGAIAALAAPTIGRHPSTLQRRNSYPVYTPRGNYLDNVHHVEQPEAKLDGDKGVAAAAINIHLPGPTSASHGFVPNASVATKPLFPPLPIQNHVNPTTLVLSQNSTPPRPRHT